MSSILVNKPNYLNWSPSDWRTYYYETQRTVTDTYADGNKVEFNCRTLNLPSLIVNIWLRTLYSNNFNATEVGGGEVDYMVDNKLLIGFDEKLNLPLYYNFKPILESALAYGSILIDYNDDGDTLMIHSYERLVNANGNHVGYRYYRKINNERVKILHSKVGEKYVKQVDGVETWKGDYMLAFECENILRMDDGATLPIYAYAIPNIEEANDSYNNMSNDRVLSRKMVLIPRTMETNNRAKLEGADTQVPIIDKNNLMFRVYDTKDDKNTPTYINGMYSPDGHIEDINFHLKFAGFHSGIGAKRISMDNTGQIKTAEEVRSDNIEYIISEANIIDEVIGTLASNLLTRAYERNILVDVKGTKEDLEEMTDRDQRLLSEYQAGLLTKRDYHMLRGMNDEEIEQLEIMDKSNNDEYTKYMNGDSDESSN